MDRENHAEHRCTRFYHRLEVDVANKEEARVRLLRKQILVGLITLLDSVVRERPSIILGVGQ